MALGGAQRASALLYILLLRVDVAPLVRAAEPSEGPQQPPPSADVAALRDEVAQLRQQMQWLMDQQQPAAKEEQELPAAGGPLAPCLS